MGRDLRRKRKRLEAKRAKRRHASRHDRGMSEWWRGARPKTEEPDAEAVVVGALAAMAQGRG